MVSPFLLYAYGVLVEKALVEVAVALNAPVAQERPPAPHLLAALHVDVDDLQVFAVTGGAVDEFSLWPCNKTAAPELDAVGLT